MGTPEQDLARYLREVSAEEACAAAIEAGIACPTAACGEFLDEIHGGPQSHSPDDLMGFWCPNCQRHWSLDIL